MATLAHFFGLLFTLLTRLLALLFQTLAHLGRYWLNDMRRRTTMTGRVASFGIGMFAFLCACSLPLALLSPDRAATTAQAQRRPSIELEAAAGSERTAATQQALTPRPIGTTQPALTQEPAPTKPPSPTVEPTATVPAPPTGQHTQVANLRSAPRVAADTVVAKLCPGDSLEYVSRQQVGDEIWFRVRVVAAGTDCDPQRASLGLEGWAAASVLAEPSYDVRAYVEQVGLTLPTAIPATATPTRAPAPQPVTPQRCDPSYPDFCLPPGIADLDCGEISYRRFTVVGADPHGFDRDRDGVGCES